MRSQVTEVYICVHSGGIVTKNANVKLCALMNGVVKSMMKALQSSCAIFASAGRMGVSQCFGA